jgi:hypothetical protein
MSFGWGPSDLQDLLTPVASRLARFMPQGLRRAARRYRTWVPIALAVAALALIVAGLMNPAPPSPK